MWLIGFTTCTDAIFLLLIDNLIFFSPCEISWKPILLCKPIFNKSSNNRLSLSSSSAFWLRKKKYTGFQLHQQEEWKRQLIDARPLSILTTSQFSLVTFFMPPRLFTDKITIDELFHVCRMWCNNLWWGSPLNRRWKVIIVEDLRDCGGVGTHFLH